MIYDGAAVRDKLVTLRDALALARDRTELDPFDEAMFNAVQGMIQASEAQIAAVEGLLKSTKKMGRKLR